MIDRIAAQLLRVFAFDHADVGHLRRFQHLHDAEVGQLHHAGVRDQHVARRDVAMHQPHRLAVQCDAVFQLGKRFGHRFADVRRDRHRDRSLVANGADQQLAERSAVDPFHRQEAIGAHFSEVESLHDVRMIEQRGDPCCHSRVLSVRPRPGCRPGQDQSCCTISRASFLRRKTRDGSLSVSHASEPKNSKAIAK